MMPCAVVIELYLIPVCAAYLVVRYRGAGRSDVRYFNVPHCRQFVAGHIVKNRNDKRSCSGKYTGFTVSVVSIARF